MELVFDQCDSSITDEDLHVGNTAAKAEYNNYHHQLNDRKYNECESTSNSRHRHHNERHLLESLSAVTTHFAHVQFRIRQIIDAPVEQKETLLKDLEEFTFKGIPEIQRMAIDSANEDDVTKDRVIVNLRKQIDELEELVKNFKYNNNSNRQQSTMRRITADKDEPDAKITFEGLNVVKRILSVLRMMSFHRREDKETLKRDYLCSKGKYNHWGDLRAQLEMAVAEVINLALEPESPIDSDYQSDSDAGSDYANGQKLAGVVRKKFAPAIQSLMQHGLKAASNAVSVRNGLTFVIGCVPRSSHFGQNDDDRTGHAWDLILKYYKMKNGNQFNSSPFLKLSQSFNLDVGLQSCTSSTQKLLITVGNIVSTHSVYKRSYNSQFKAFVCAALNAKMLVNWLQSIYRCRPLIEMYYESWSYAVRTGFEDTLKSIEKLNHYHFNLPVDIAIHQLQNIKDAF